MKRSGYVKEKSKKDLKNINLNNLNPHKFKFNNNILDYYEK